MSGISLETPLADRLTSVVHNKITEEGWSSEEDTSLAEYITLMLVNGKTQDQISSELASELLQDVDGIPQFAQWLSEQVTMLKNESDGSAVPITQTMSDGTQQLDTHGESAETNNDEIPAAYDADMGDNAPDNAPRGPKGMHGGRPAGNRGRMTGQMNKAMDRSNDSILHRVRGQVGSGRINSHMRGTPKGPRGGQDRPGLQKALNNMPMGGPAQPMQSPMMQNGGQSGQSGQPGQPMMPMSPQQQMEFMAMMERQAQMMAQFTGMIPPTGINPNFQQNGQQQNGNGRSLFDRVERGRGGRGRGRGLHQNSPRNGVKQEGTKQEDVQMDTESGAPSLSMDVEQNAPTGKFDPFSQLCRYNTRCINKDCAFAHQSPAAPEGVNVDMGDTCSFGAACKNFRCVGRHPSPAQVKAHQSEEMCKFFPNCTNPHCHFIHPSVPLCRNGADCKVEHCKFTHPQTACKFKPCMNPRCTFKHEEGQKKAPTNNVWTAAGMPKADTDMEGNHLSERKFVEDGDEEELIKPENSGEEELIKEDVIT